MVIYWEMWGGIRMNCDNNYRNEEFIVIFDKGNK